MNVVSASEWNAAVVDLPGAHILQSWEWGQFKAISNWQPLPQLWRDQSEQVRAAALVLRRSVLRRLIPGGMSVLYIPRGPMLDWNDKSWAKRVVGDLQQLARQQGAILLKMDPELVLGEGVPGTLSEKPNPAGQQRLSELLEAGWSISEDQVQFRNTVCLDLSGEEDHWLERMKPKTRYNIRLAQRKDVHVRTGSVADLPRLYAMYAETSVRDGFVIRAENYYLTLWQTFIERGMAEPLIAEVEGQAVAAIMLFYLADRAWYLYGMSRQVHRERMPSYLLQWEAMRRAKARGCSLYDLWGAPDVFDESDSMWGVYRFKEGLGGTVVRTAGALDYPARPQLYVLYTRILPRILAVMRRRRKARMRQEVSL
jgi:peptidoglycan pentaglycine glycine transferase (the first glycine)